MFDGSILHVEKIRFFLELSYTGMTSPVTEPCVMKRLNLFFMEKCLYLIHQVEYKPLVVLCFVNKWIVNIKNKC